MARRTNPQKTSAAIAELQTALDEQEAAERLVANKLAKLARLLSDADPCSSSRTKSGKSGPVLVVSNEAQAEPVKRAKAKSG